MHRIRRVPFGKTYLPLSVEQYNKVNLYWNKYQTFSCYVGSAYGFVHTCAHNG